MKHFLARSISFTLALAMLLCLAACGSREQLTEDVAATKKPYSAYDKVFHLNDSGYNADGVYSLTVKDLAGGIWQLSDEENIELVCRRLAEMRFTAVDDTNTVPNLDSNMRTGSVLHTGTITVFRGGSESIECYEFGGGFIRVKDGDQWYAMQWRDDGSEKSELAQYLTRGISFLTQLDAVNDLRDRSRVIHTDMIEMTDNPTELRTEEIMVDRQSKSDKRVREFLKNLEGFEYLISTNEGVKRQLYTVPDDSKVFNCTPTAVSRARGDIDLFIVHGQAGCSCFVMVGDEVYRPFYRCDDGVLKMCLWDYDGNGVDDIVACHASGSGYITTFLSVFDLTMLKTTCFLSDDSTDIDLGWDGENIYLNGYRVYGRNTLLYVSDEAMGTR